jgi:hypothetical protein
VDKTERDEVVDDLQRWEREREERNRRLDRRLDRGLDRGLDLRWGVLFVVLVAALALGWTLLLREVFPP